MNTHISNFKKKLMRFFGKTEFIKNNRGNFWTGIIPKKFDFYKKNKIWKAKNQYIALSKVGSDF